MSYKFYLYPTLLLALTGCAGQGDSTVRLPWWGWLILILALAVVVWLLIRAQRGEEQKAESVEPDNLTLIEGIGPKIQSILQAVGIHKQLHSPCCYVTRNDQNSPNRSWRPPGCDGYLAKTS